MASNNAIGESTRTTLGLSQTAPSTVTSYDKVATLNGITATYKVIDGTDSADSITAVSNTNYTFGMGGNDMLDLRGSITLGIGGLGADTFKIGQSGTGIGGLAGGQVMDFSTAEGDKIDLSSIVNNFSDLTISTNSNSTNATITYNGWTYNVTGLDVALTSSNVMTANATTSGASESADTLTGTSVAETILGLGGNDTITGLGGNDTLNGNGGNDSLLGGDGDDLVYGGQGADNLNGNAGNDAVNGNLGSDTVFGGQGNDSIHGGQDADVVNGNLGSDFVWGDLGNDSIYGGQSNDTLDGGAGDDYLHGDMGNDQLTGGANIDRFYFGGTFGTDTVTDFVAGTDKLLFATSVFANSTAALAASSVVNGNLVISHGSDTVTLTGVTSISASDLEFV